MLLKPMKLLKNNVNFPNNVSFSQFLITPNSIKMKEQSTRQLKVGQQIKEIISEIFMKQDIYDPQTLKPLEITISEVKVSADLRNATVFFFPLAGKDYDKLEAVLNPISGKIKGVVGKKMHIKRIPDLHFKLDDSFEKAQKVEELIKDT